MKIASMFTHMFKHLSFAKFHLSETLNNIEESYSEETAEGVRTYETPCKMQF